MIYIVIPVFNRWHFTEACLQSLQQQIYTDFKIIVVDHGSSDGTSENISRQFPKVIVLRGDESMWWTAATNLGVKYAIENKADYVLTLNNDLVVYPDYISSLLQVLQKNGSCLVGSVSVDVTAPDMVDFCGVKWNRFTAKIVNLSSKFPNIQSLKNNYPLGFIETDMLPGRGTLIPIGAFKKVGMFDDRKFPHYGADIDHSLKAKKNGYKLLISVNSIVQSHLSQTGITVNDKNSFLFYRLRNIFFSKRSPNNLKTRYHLAINHSPIKFLYFLLDVGRITFSIIFK